MGWTALAASKLFGLLQDTFLNQQSYRRIVSGRDQRLFARLLRMGLGAASLLYRPAVWTRNRLYDRGVLRSFSADVPVVCIGNLTAGGTGKTPLVIWLCRYLRGKGLACAVLTRGYKTQTGQLSDEPALLARACDGVAVVINPDRVEGAKKAITQHGAQVLVMDDGFGHRRLKRDSNIVTVDATCPFGYGKMLPAGLLREPYSSLKRAAAVVITRADQVDAETIVTIEKQIRDYVPDIPVAKTAHKLSHAVSFPNRIISLDTLRQEKIFGFCGIGNPEAFFDSLNRQGLAVCGSQVFDDHHNYTDTDMEAVYQQAKSCGATTIICTQKDWVKSANLRTDESIVFAYMAMELDFLDGLDTISRLLDSVISVYLSEKN